MATYQSRGSFHSTEQLSFHGEGLYRSFLHITPAQDPLPEPNIVEQVHGDPGFTNPSVTNVSVAGSPDGGSHERSGGPRRVGGQYYALENDISFCIVSEVLTSRLTRWQLIFEDSYRSQHGPLRSGKSGSLTGISAASSLSIWLARGAPRRWFDSAEGFGITGAPTSVGRVSYNVSTGAPCGKSNCVAAYTVLVKRPRSSVGGAPLAVWKLRWPGAIQQQHVKVMGCSIAQVDVATGIVAVATTSAAFSVEATYA